MFQGGIEDIAWVETKPFLTTFRRDVYVEAYVLLLGQPNISV